MLYIGLQALNINYSRTAHCWSAGSGGSKLWFNKYITAGRISMFGKKKKRLKCRFGPDLMTTAWLLLHMMMQYAQSSPYSDFSCLLFVTLPFFLWIGLVLPLILSGMSVSHKLKKGNWSERYVYNIRFHFSTKAYLKPLWNKGSSHTCTDLQVVKKRKLNVT